MTEITPEVIRAAWTLPVLCILPLWILDEIVWPLQDWQAKRKEAKRLEDEARKARRRRI